MLGEPTPGWGTRLLEDGRGASLVELVVAIMLLTVALLALAGTIPSAMYSVVAGGFQTTATLLAQQSVETAKSTPYASLSTLNTTGGSGACGGGTGSFIAVPPYDGFLRCLDVQTATPSALTTTVTAVVRFTGAGGTGGGTIYDTTVVTVLAQP
jgi:Flp pilus assembly protein TadG